MRVVEIIIFLAFAIFLHYAESSSSSSSNNIPEPEEGVLPSRYYYAGGTIHEENRPNAHPFIVDGYFLGMEDGAFLHPIFIRYPSRVYSFRQRRLVDITTDERLRLLQEEPLVSRRRGQQQQPQRQASTSGPFGASAFTELPSRYFYTQGSIHEHGRPNTRPCIVHNYFLGMLDRNNNLYPVDSRNPFHVYSLVARTMVMISPELRNYLLSEL